MIATSSILGNQQRLLFLYKNGQVDLKVDLCLAVMAGSSLLLVAAAIAVACAIISSYRVAVNEKLAELFCKKGETVDCMFTCRFH